MIANFARWFDRTILELGREFRWTYLPPLMVYLAAGVSGLTGIVGAFFVKDYLGLSAEFLAALGFWIGIPWALKMPLGHLVDLIWRYKFILVYLGAGLIAASLLIMIGLLADPTAMAEVMSVEAWFVISELLAPVGFVVQDVVADAMTVEAVPNVDDKGAPVDAATKRLMHTTMQTLGRVAIIGGGIFVSLLNVYMFGGVESMDEATKIATYIDIYLMALVIPVISVSGVIFGGWLKLRQYRALRNNGMNHIDAWGVIHTQGEKPEPNWWILGGSLVFVVFTLTLGLSDFEFNQEVIFLGSFSIVSFLMWRLMKVLDEDARRVLLGTAIIIFIFRATPSIGPGGSWWSIDVLKFDQQFFSVLSLISSTLTLLGMFIFRRFMAERSIAYIMVFLTLISTVLALPNIAMYYGLHEWTASVTGGVVDARFIAVINTAVESPLGQVAMIPMLAWIANSAPSHLKATFFAVMASFTNLALSLSNLGTKYLNQIFSVSREIRDRATGEVQTPADYSELGWLLIVASLIGLLAPLLAVWMVRQSRLKSA
ncbi:MAG: hypothetical protein OEZ43_11870 [Gammaproteobacteria bacterium]|nr:hypothetical protein [Gammaproteobacteria bacterium]